MTIFIVGADIYSYRLNNQKKSRARSFPTFSIIIPAHNEEQNILRAVKSVVSNSYPLHKREIIVVDDGSTDSTYEKVSNYIKSYRVKNLFIFRQKNKGKADALNNGMRNYSHGDLVMCLDSDSYIAPDGLKKMASHFRDSKVAAVSANIKIIPDGTLLNFIQRYEYTVAYQMKRAHTVFNIEYIVGGIGSTFRKDILKRVGYYDTNTVTEDIDLTMKVLRLGNKENKVIYGADVLTYTESVLDISGLIKQRFRWKWGRSQTFLKNTKMFFNRDKKYSKGLTFVYLPLALFNDITFSLEPLIITYIFYIIIRFSDLRTLLSTVLIISTYLILNVFMEQSMNRGEKVKLALAAPAMYLFFYVLSFVEYVALVKTLLKINTLKKSITKKRNPWTHVARFGAKRISFASSK